MSKIIDKRDDLPNQSVGNRQRFIKMYKHVLRDQLQLDSDGDTIKQIINRREVSVPRDSLQEYDVQYDHSKGTWNHTVAGNSAYNKGDTINKNRRNPQMGGSGQGAGNGENTLDEYKFLLTKDELVGIYFGDLDLPKFIKESVGKIRKTKAFNSGSARDGNMCNLNLIETMRNALGRRLASSGENIPWLDDTDLRFKHPVYQLVPCRRAVMFCVMDVSGSMSQEMKAKAKEFYLMLYIFLTYKYEDIDVVFIHHTETAAEVDEEEFFYGQLSGGTLVSPALNLVDTIITDRYDPLTWNIYVVQSGDGDNSHMDTKKCCSILSNTLLSKCQFFGYVEIVGEFNGGRTSPMYLQYEGLKGAVDNLEVLKAYKSTSSSVLLRQFFNSK